MRESTGQWIPISFDILRSGCLINEERNKCLICNIQLIGSLGNVIFHPSFIPYHTNCTMREICQNSGERKSVFRNILCFFFYLGFFLLTFTICRTAGEAQAHFYLLHRHLDNSRAITTESVPLQNASSQTLTGNFWFPSVSS